MRNFALRYWLLWLGLALLAGAGVGLASCVRPLAPTEVVVTDSTTRREVQRLVAVSVPGDSASLTTRLTWDAGRQQFRPVSIYRRVGRLGLWLTVDARGELHTSAAAAATTVQVPVADTYTNRVRVEHKTVVKETFKTHWFDRWARWIAAAAVLLTGGAVYLKFFSPFRFL